MKGTVCNSFHLKIHYLSYYVDCAINLSGNLYDRTSGANIYESIEDPLWEMGFEKR